MIIWNTYLYLQKEQEWKAIERFREEMHLIEQTSGQTGLWNQLKDYLYGTEVLNTHHIHVQIDASMTRQEIDRAS